jgi:major membrane immunogen (membrane-anchored lipoprotein)
MKNKQFIVLIGVCCIALCAVSCSKSGYSDGVYSGVSAADDKGAFGEVSVTVAGGRITECRYVTRQRDGSVKDADYGKVNGEVSNVDFYNKAQLAVRAMDEYARSLVETQSVNDIDAISGATIAYDQFTEAVSAALARK